jgi:hypothetical protein
MDVRQSETEGLSFPRRVPSGQVESRHNNVPHLTLQIGKLMDYRWIPPAQRAPGAGMTKVFCSKVNLSIPTF